MCKGQAFWINNSFWHNNVKYGQIEISRQHNNRYWKLCGIQLNETIAFLLQYNYFSTRNNWKFSWFIHVTLRINTNAIHKDFTALQHILSFYPDTWCPHLLPLRKWVLCWCTLTTVSVLSSPTALIQGFTEDLGNLSPP